MAALGKVFAGKGETALPGNGLNLEIALEALGNDPTLEIGNDPTLEIGKEPEALGNDPTLDIGKEPETLLPEGEPPGPLASAGFRKVAEQINAAVA